MADFSKKLGPQLNDVKKYLEMGLSNTDAIRSAVQLRSGKTGLPTLQYVFAPFKQQYYRNQGRLKFANPFYLAGQALGGTWSGLKKGWNAALLTDPEDAGSLQQNAKKKIPWARSAEQIKKYLVPQSIIDRTTGKVTGGKQNMAQVRKTFETWLDDVNKWNASVQDYNKHAIDAPREKINPTWKNFLLLHRRDNQVQRLQAANAASQKARLQAGGGKSGVQQGSQFLGNTAMQDPNSYQAGLWQTFWQKIFPTKDKKPNIGQQALRAANRNQQILSNVSKLPGDHQAAFWATTVAPATGVAGGATSPFIRGALANEAGFRTIDYVSNKLADIHTAGRQQIVKALSTGNTEGLTPQQKAYIKQTYPLPSWNQQDPTVREMWLTAANNQQQTVKNIHDTYAKALYFIAAVAPGVTNKTKLAGRVAQGVGDAIMMRSDTEAPIENQIANGKVPKEALNLVVSTLKQKNIPVTLQNIAQTFKVIKQMSTPQTAGNSGLVQSVAGWIAPKAIQRALQDYQGYGALSPQQQQAKRTEMIRGFNALKDSKLKQQALRTFVADPKNRQILLKLFDKYNASQLGNIKDNIEALSQFISPVMSDQLQETRNTLRGIAQQSALTRFRNGLKQQDPDKFEQNMIQWLPLFSKAQGEGNYDQVKAQARKAIWDQVKKNPLYINKAMSFWALQNGYPQLHKFLADNGAFYGTVAGLGIGLPLTIALMSSLFSKDNDEESEEEQQRKKREKAVQRYQTAYMPQRNVTDRRLIVG